MADFQDIIARLTATTTEGQSPRSDQTQNPIWAPQPGMPHRPSYHQPSVSSPIFSPQPGGPQPIHSSAIMSPNPPASSSATPQPEASSRTNLLNLLKFAPSGQDASRSSSAILNPHLERSRTSSGDQAASFVNKPPLPSMLSRPDMKGESTPSSADNPQQSLLKLLNQRAPSQSSVASNFGGRAERIISEDQAVGAASSDKVQEISDPILGASDVGSGADTVRRAVARDNTPIRIFGGGEPDKPSNLKNSIFNYVNPFDELSASSPQTRTPRTEAQKDPIALKASLFRQSGDLSSRTHDKPEYGTSAPVSKSRKLSSGIPREISSCEPSAQGDGRSPLVALMGIDAKEDQTEAVSQTLSDLAKTVEKPVEEAMSQLNVNADDNAQHDEEKLLTSEKDLHDLVDEVQEVAKDLHKELQDEGTKKEFEKNMPADVAEAVEGTVEDLVHGVPEDWEDMDELASPNPRVFTFPMRPFHAIDIQPTHAVKPGLREGGVMDIARLKKDFDQLDRNLASATKSFITYAALKHGGFRLIHQGSGKDKHVFRGPSNADRVFNIAMCSSSAPSQHVDVDAIIATGLDGSVYWTAVNRSRGDGFDDEDLGREGFIFPPAPSTDDNTSGAQLKTRAKPSARHTEYFAIGRGKSIYVVWPYVIRTRDYTDQKTRLVDTAKYFRHFQLVISTGKAAKDFAFSEDDTVIVSLDKSGKMKFWDIRELVDSANSSVPTPPKGQFELRIPKMTFITTAPNEKSWPTSIMFIDKERPYLKGGAIRYLIVGFKQNHTLQLWDLGLRKAVQELNFPHDNETDPICSLAYHPRTGVLALGHPTRNSIFLIHVSCPKYNLGHMSQAKYIQRLASQDSTLPGPESTAIMSGVREVSFASKGQLRSISMQDKPITENEEDEPMFELYVMHSKGVTCLTITKSDIGWTKENKPINPVNGEEEGFIVVHDLQPAPSAAPSEPSINGDSLTPTPAQKRSGKSSRASQTATPEPTVRASSALRHAEKHVSDVASANGGDKTAKKSHESVVKPSVTAAVDPSLVTPNSFTRPNLNSEITTASSKPLTSADIKGEAMSEPAADVEGRAAETAGASKTLSDVPIVDITRGMVHDFSTTVEEQLESLHRRLDDDKRVQDAAGNAKQDAILRLVSSTLTENVEKSLNRIINTNIEKVLLPTIRDATTKALDQKLPALLGEHLRSNLPKDIKSALPGAVSTAMQGPNILRSLSENVTEKLTQHVELQLQTSLGQTIIPAFNRVATQEAQTIGEKLETRVGDQLRQVEVQRAQDNQKLDQLTSLVRGLSETVRAMANAQGTFQSEILKLQNQVAQQLPQQKPIGSERATGATSRAATEPEAESRPQSQLQSQQPNPEDEEVENITSLLQEGRYEEGTIQWLQSKRQGALFTRLFYRVYPPYLSRLSSPLIALSCAAAVSMDLTSLITERLNWLETVLNIIERYYEQTEGRMDDDTREVCPNIMEVITERLQKLYARLANEVADDETIRRVAFLARRANSIKEGSGVGVGLTV
ncbi:MAG: hypothetical protein Q9165_000110 [Trypethelium subeluteriae]